MPWCPCPQLWRGSDGGGEDDEGRASSEPAAKRVRRTPSASRGSQVDGGSGAGGGDTPQTAGGDDDMQDITELMQRKNTKPTQQPVTKFFLPAHLESDFKHAWATAAAVAGLTTNQVCGLRS
jgi:hypothetical protein